jgi:hypothetical protein
MKLFTIEEANFVLKEVRPLLLDLQKLHFEIANFREFSKMAAKASEYGGGISGGSNYVKSLFKFSELIKEINDFGIQIKDFSRGLIDFPCLRDDRIVLLCWQIGEGDEIEWWHEIEAGFQGRQRL